MMTNQSEFCLLCSSKNQMLVGIMTEAWECWNCNAKYWLDDQARLEYCIFHDVSIVMADWALQNYTLLGKPPIFAPTQQGVL